MQTEIDGESAASDAQTRDLSALTGWALTAGGTGHEVQCLGVLEALGVKTVVKRIAPPKPFEWMAPWGPAAPSADVAPPWPDILVVSGRQSIPYARMIRRRSGGRTFTLAMQSPGVPPSRFDLVWVPEHDRLRGDNVIVTLTSPHRLTPQRLAAEAARHADDVATLPRPRIAVLVGGTSGAYTFSSREARQFADDLADFARRHGCSLMVAPSRRTGRGKAAILSERLAGVGARVWDFTGENPYFGYIGLADAFVVTCDSVNMLGEAAFTGKPIHAYRLPGGNDKFDSFHRALVERGVMRWFSGDLDVWTYPALDATNVIATAVRARLDAHLRQLHGYSEV